MNVTKTYSLRSETVELIAKLAEKHGSLRRVIELGVAMLEREDRTVYFPSPELREMLHKPMVLPKSAKGESE